MRWLILLAALLSVACARQPEVEARPALWVVRDADTTIWLLGTIHLLPEGVAWQGGPVGEAIAGADTLVTEIPEGNPQAQAATFLKLGRGKTAAPGVPAKYAALKPWAAALAISADAARTIGATPDAGVEATLAKAFATRRHDALESFEGQLAMFDALPPPAQQTLLRQSIAEASDAKTAYTRTFDAWRRGDERAIAASFDSALTGELRATLVTSRKRRWTDWIANRLEKPGKVLVAVGAGHLAGAGGIPALLRERSAAVTRLQ